MAADVSLLDFLAPAVAGVAEEDKIRALEIAAAYRPSCLLPAEQDTAQVYYAAWLLAGRMAQMSLEVVPTGVVSEKEGDRSVTYGNNGVTDAYGYYGHWQRLNDICGYGAITVGIPPVIYGYDQGY